MMWLNQAAGFTGFPFLSDNSLWRERPVCSDVIIRMGNSNPHLLSANVFLIKDGCQMTPTMLLKVSEIY